MRHRACFDQYPSTNYLCYCRLKELIKLHASANALPKLDKRRFKGKYLSSDYLACLIDVLREKFDGDFQQVAEVIKVESNITRKKGFAEAPAAP